MRLIVLLFAFFYLHLFSFGQSKEFEGVLIYELNTYKGIEKQSNISQIKYSIKDNLWKAELIGNEDAIVPMSYSLLVDLKLKEATILANISNTKLAVDISERFFQIEKTSSFIPKWGSEKLIVARFECNSGEVINNSSEQKTDTSSVCYTTSYEAIPFQFETATAPGLIVSIQQDKNSFWELTEIHPNKLKPDVFKIPLGYKLMSPSQFQEFLTTLGELDIEMENLKID